MELPKNITQIGEVDKTCKVYVEDYVVSYIKQLNRQAENKEISVALYGKHELENGIDYHFIYGACKVDQLPKEVRHLSQAQMQEIERFRRKYFPETTFAGYRLLNGEMIEGFYICDRDICIYVAGYAQFYEKNDAMLAYMLDVREEIPPEYVDQEKYEKVKQRQEERRAAAEATEKNVSYTADADRKILKLPTSQNLQRMRLAAVAVFALLCLFGIATFKEETGTAQEQGSLLAVNASVSDPEELQKSEPKDKLVIEDKLDEALQAENQTDGADSKALEAESQEAVSQETESQDAASQEAESQEAASQEAESQEAASQEAESQEAASQEAESQEAASQEAETQATQSQAAEAAVSEAVAYVIQPGDTLIAISKRQYGTDTRVQDICERNKITDPNNIKQGQVLMLPR